MLNIHELLDDEKCYAKLRKLRWPEGTRCSFCGSSNITKQGHDEKQPTRRRYACKACDKRFDDLTNTIFARRHQPLKIWILCLYLMGLNLSNLQIAKELGLKTRMMCRR